eukprot:m.119095 g.119095  ORF g.119095 m.119095 type:complete len:1318 (-) comp9542_c0_seq1:40-3993(-)
MSDEEAAASAPPPAVSLRPQMTKKPSDLSAARALLQANSPSTSPTPPSPGGSIATSPAPRSASRSASRDDVVGRVPLRQQLSRHGSELMTDNPLLDEKEAAIAAAATSSPARAASPRTPGRGSPGFRSGKTVAEKEEELMRTRLKTSDPRLRTQSSEPINTAELGDKLQRQRCRSLGDSQPVAPPQRGSSPMVQNSAAAPSPPPVSSGPAPPAGSTVLRVQTKDGKVAHMHLPPGVRLAMVRDASGKQQLMPVRLNEHGVPVPVPLVQGRAAAAPAAAAEAPEPEKFVPPVIADPPTITNIESLSAHAQWVSASEASEPVVAYELEIAHGKMEGKGNKRKLAFNDYRQAYRGVNCQAELTNLAPGGKYQARVRAVCEQEPGPWTEPAAFETAAVKPGEPAPPIVTGSNKTSLSFKWNSPDDCGGADIEHFQLLWDRGDQSLEPDAFVEAYAGPERRFKLPHGLNFGTKCRFVLIATNRIGASPPSLVCHVTTAAAAPNAPSAPELVSASVDALRLSWTEPESNGSPITNYLLEYRDSTDDRGFFQAAYNGPDRECCVERLARFQEYQFRLFASNSVGRSVSSPQAAFSTRAAAPGAPTRPEVVSKVSSDGFVVTWAAQDSGGSSVTKHQLQIDAGSEDMSSPGKAAHKRASAPQNYKTVYTGAEARFAFTDLRPGTVYHIRAACGNESGFGPYSEPLRAATAPVPPHAPINLSLKPQKKGRSGMLAVQWQEPEYCGGAPITEYRLESCVAESGQFKPVYTGTEPLALVSDLEPGVRYVFRAAAKNRAGVSPWSDEFSAATSSAAPLAPVDVAFKRATSTTVEIVWVQGDAQGSEITEYRVETSDSGDEGTFSRALASATESATIKQLKPSSIYFLRVQAVNGVGAGQFSSETIMVKTEAAVPLTPLAPELIEAGTDTLSISWTSPADQGSPIFAYLIHANHKLVAELTDCTELLYTITGLEPGQQHKVTVTAVNAVGKSQPSPMLRAATLHVPPPAPALTLVNATHTTIKLSWRSSKDAAVIQSTLQMSQDGKRFDTAFVGRAQTFKAARLDAESTYYFRIADTNSAGMGEFCAPVAFETMTAPLVALKAPQVHVMATADGAKAAVAWANTVTRQSELQHRCVLDEHVDQKFSFRADDADASEDSSEDDQSDDEGSSRAAPQGKTNGKEKTKSRSPATTVTLQTQFSTTYTGARCSLTLNGLVPGGVYELRVRAIDRNGGLGEFSKPIRVEVDDPNAPKSTVPTETSSYAKHSKSRNSLPEAPDGDVSNDGSRKKVALPASRRRELVNHNQFRNMLVGLVVAVVAIVLPLLIATGRL